MIWRPPPTRWPCSALLKQTDARFRNCSSKAPAYELVPARAGLMDDLLRFIWLRIFRGRYPDLALAAVGGYGRGELHPAWTWTS